MDIGSKVFSSILCELAFVIIKRHDARYQFDSTPRVSYQDGSFTLKTMFHTRYNYNLPSCVVFADLVKYFEIVNHKILLTILSRFGDPKKCCNVIKRLYKNISVKLKICKLSWDIGQSVGVKQGNCMAPSLLLFLIMSFEETLEEECGKHGLTKAEFSRQSHSPRNSGKLIRHKPK